MLIETRHHMTAQALAYTIELHSDDDPENPWTDDAGAVPLIAWHGRRDGFADYSQGHDILDPVAHMSDRQLQRNLAAILAACPGHGWDPSTFDSFVRNVYPGLTLREARREYLTEWLGDGETSEKRLDAIAAMWRAIGVPAEVRQTRGYSQGDWAALLFVAHPDAVKSWGFASIAAYRKACGAGFEGSANTYGAWAWGGVIGYIVKDPDGGEVDSCWGFFPKHGPDYFPLDVNHAYAIGEAVDAADHDSKARAERDAVAMAESIQSARPDMVPA